MSGKTVIQKYLDHFGRYEAGLNGTRDNVHHQNRREAMRLFSENGFPTTRNEEWKYTNISPVIAQVPAPLIKSENNEIERQLLENICYRELDAWSLVFVNGFFRPELSHLKELPAGVIADSLANAQKNKSIELNFSTSEAFDAFSALNSAFYQDGAVVFIPEGRIVEKPFHFVFINQPQSEQAMINPRNLVIAGNSSQAEIFETFISGNDHKYISNVVTEFRISENARIEHYRYQNESLNAAHFSTTEIQQADNSYFHSTNISFGGKLVRNNFNAALDGQGIESVLNGLYIGEKDQHIDNHTSIDHRKPNCQSHELYKGVLNDTAHGVFNGKIFVRQDAQKTNAIQNNSGLLLSDSAMLDTKPQLEIFADDVRCTHGATVGQINEEALFYLRSRGIGLQKAKNLMIYAFASDVVDQIRNEKFRERMAELLSRKLHTIHPA